MKRCLKMPKIPNFFSNILKWRTRRRERLKQEEMARREQITAIESIPTGPKARLDILIDPKKPPKDKATAAFQLARLISEGTPEATAAIPVLGNLLGHKDIGVRINVAVSLGKLGKNNSLTRELLEKAIKVEKDQKTKELMKEALREAGFPYPKSILQQ